MRVTASLFQLFVGILITYLQLAFDAAQPAETVVLGRFVLMTGTGAVQLWQQDKVQWTREESLSEIKVAEMIELPEKKSVMSHMNVENETMSGRLSRQLMDAKVGFVCVGAKTIY